MNAVDRIAPAIAAPAPVGADVTNVERILCVIAISPRFALRRSQRGFFDTAPSPSLNANYDCAVVST